MLEHLLVDFVADITLVHHDDVLHAIGAIPAFVMVTDLGDQLEQQLGAFFIIDFRLLTKLLQNDLFRIVSIKIDGIAFDALTILHILQILHQQFVLDGHMSELGHIQVKVHEHILFNAGIGHFDPRDGNKFDDRSSMGFLCLV